LLTSVHRRPEKAIHTVQAIEIRLFNGGHDRVPLHPQDIAVRTLRVGIHLVPVHGTHGTESERTISTLNTTVVPLFIVYLHLNGVVRVGWEPGASKDWFVVL